MADSELHPSVAARVVAHELGGGTDAAAAAERIHDELAALLGPVIGETGHAALWARGITLALRAGAVAEAPPPAASLRERLSTAARASPDPAAFLSAFVGAYLRLLSTFIGDGLTRRLVARAWPGALGNGDPEEEKP